LARAFSATRRSTARWWWRIRATAPTSNVFARLTTGHQRLDASALNETRPSLEGRFRDGLFYPDEGHVEPRRVLPELHARFTAAGGPQSNSTAIRQRMISTAS